MKYAVSVGVIMVISSVVMGRLAVIDGVGHPDEVFRRLTAAVDAARRPG